ncbi:MAG TPA: FAD-dependent thymidylate synthase [Candidatus Hypogeohydataceae bacterium YC38]|nr:FAD-dependent thymidylate synthase [Candidatus Brocadiales bacterium]
MTISTPPSALGGQPTSLEGARLKVILLAHTPEPEKLVAQAAKLCYSPASIEDLRETIARTDQEKFIRKLLSMGHMSPVEHISFTFGVEGISRVCTHQLVRHRLASYSQQSQRYVGKDAKKTGKPFEFIIPPSVIEAGKKEWFVEKMLEVQRWYDELVSALGGLGYKGESAYEDARFLLPNAAETKIIITMNARELLHFFRVRCCNRAQWEIREMAIEMLRHVKSMVPSIFGNAGPACVRGNCSEGPLTCGKIEEVRARFRGLA